MSRGACLCGAVTFKVTGRMRPAIACHCGQCQRQSGHYWAATSVPEDCLTFDRMGGVTWYRASETAQRGFCRECGSTLFWKPDDAERFAISMGALGDTGLTLSAHVFLQDKSDYYQIGGDVPQHQSFSGDENA